MYRQALHASAACHVNAGVTQQVRMPAILSMPHCVKYIQDHKLVYCIHGKIMIYKWPLAFLFESLRPDAYIIYQWNQSSVQVIAHTAVFTTHGFNSHQPYWSESMKTMTNHGIIKFWLHEKDKWCENPILTNLSYVWIFWDQHMYTDDLQSGLYITTASKHWINIISR